MVVASFVGRTIESRSHLPQDNHHCLQPHHDTDRHLPSGAKTCTKNKNKLVGMSYNILKISLTTAFVLPSLVPSSVFAKRSSIDEMPRPFKLFTASAPRPSGKRSTVPSATRERTIGSGSYLPHSIMELMTSRNRFREATDGGEEVEYMYELVLRMAVATESRTFLLFERAQALAHWTILNM